LDSGWKLVWCFLGRTTVLLLAATMARLSAAGTNHPLLVDIGAGGALLRESPWTHAMKVSVLVSAGLWSPGLDGTSWILRPMSVLKLPLTWRRKNINRLAMPNPCSWCHSMKHKLPFANPFLVSWPRLGHS
jgi:hypothetical protein